MPYRVRNAYYLRISSNSVLPFYLYLDERHVNWMSDQVLQRVLADLRPLIIPKLKAEADVQLGSTAPNAKKGTVDVHRGDTYQFAFFFRKTEPHSVLVKTRNFVAAPMQAPSAPAARVSQPVPKPKGRGTKRKAGQPARSASKKGKRRAADSDEEPIAVSTDDDSDGFDPFHKPNAPRRSARAKKVAPGQYREGREDDDAIDIEMEDTGAAPEGDTTATPSQRQAQTSDDAEASSKVKNEDVDDTTLPPSHPEEQGRAARTPIELHVDEEEAKPKPVLQLKYQGFNIYGRCLCIVVEPWPPVRAPAASRAPSFAPIFARTPSADRAQSAMPPPGIPRHRERTPLFLPDDDRRSMTPAPFPMSPPRFLPPLPQFDMAGGDEDDEDGDGELMAFTQSLNTVGDFRASEAIDDDEIDGAVFFADADEAREL